MAEFDSGGLSAVSAFFNVHKKDTEPEATQQPSLPRARARHGVGSGSSSVKQVKLPLTENTVGRVLNVGKRKQPEVEDELDVTASHYESDDNVEEEGRTALAEKPRKLPADAVPPTEMKSPKKKKGKKEREADQASDTEVDCRNDEKESSQKEKRKRRKIRSRQKNIFKDKRLSQHKPGHLIPGRPDFRGRPLTAETRYKLKLAPSRSSRQHDNSENVGQVETNEQSASSDVLKLAIDHILDHGEPQLDASEVDKSPIEHKKKRKKKKEKSKYKNLAI